MIANVTTIGAVNVSNRVQRIKVKRKATDGVGTFELTLDNHDGIYNSGFSADLPVSIDLGTSLNSPTYQFFKGYVDVAVDTFTQDENAKVIQALTILGRDYGQDSQNKTVWAVNAERIGKIVEGLLKYGASPILDGLPTGYTEISYTDPGGTPQVFFDSKGRTHISTCLKELLQNANYDGYVDLNKTFKMFPIGTVSSGIQLFMLNNDSRNNLLHVEHTRFDAFELRNVILAYGKNRVEDSWTDYGCAGEYLNVYNCGEISHFMSNTPTAPRKGVASIKIVNNAPEEAEATFAWSLNFPKWNLWYIDFTRVTLDELKWYFYFTRTGAYPGEDAAVWKPFIILIDTDDNQIKWTFGGTYAFNKWLDFTVPVGTNLSSEAQIKKYSDLMPWDKAEDFWFYHVGSTFNWKVKTIIFNSGFSVRWPLPMGGWTATIQKTIDYVLFDYLCLPQQIVAVNDQSAGSPYKKRQLVVEKPDITYQYELEMFAESLCNKRKNPIEVLNITCDGKAGLVNNVWKWWPGLNVSINEAENLRLLEINHLIEDNAEDSGLDHIVKASLVPKFAEVDLLRWSYTAHGDVAVARQLHDRVRALEKTGTLQS